MPTLVEAVGEGIEEFSCTMLVRTGSVVSVLVAVGATVRMGLCELMTDGVVGTGTELTMVLLTGTVTLADAGADAVESDSDGERVAEGTTED